MTPPAPGTNPISPWRWWVCLLLLLTTIINYMDRLALNQMALRIKTYFGMSNYEYSILESAFFAIDAITTGYIFDEITQGNPA